MTKSANNRVNKKSSCVNLWITLRKFTQNTIDKLDKESWVYTLFVEKTRNMRITLFAGALLGCFFIFKSDEISNFWKWIKVQSTEMYSSKPTLMSDPIGVFSQAFIGYTNELDPIDKSKLINLKFESITRFRLSVDRFNAEFSSTAKNKYFPGCQIIIEGILDNANGGISEGNYITITDCKGKGKARLNGFKLVAFPPDINVMLAPSNYALLKIETE